MMRRNLLVGIAIAALAASTSVSANHSETKAFLQVAGDQVVVCDQNGLGVGLGGACFEVVHDGRVVISIQDDSNNPSSGFYCYQEKPGGSCTGEQTFCAIIEVVIPPGSIQLVVFIDGPVFGNPLLSPCASVSVGVSGTITAHFLG